MESIKNHMKRSKLSLYLGVLFSIALLYSALYTMQAYNYLLFHSMVEMLGIIPSFMISIIVMYVWSYLDDNNFLSFIGIAFFYIGLIDFLHMLAYEGMAVFPGYDANLPTELWILARYVQVSAVFIGSLLIRRKTHIKKGPIIFVYAIIVAYGLHSIFISGIFPDCFVVGLGLTRFKIISEYIMIFILLVSGGLLWWNRELMGKKVIYYLMGSIGVQIISELSFTKFASLIGFGNFFGHFAKVIWVVLFFGAVLEIAIKSPSKTIYTELLKSEAALRNNVEELKISEVALKINEERLLRLFESMSEGFVVIELIKNHDEACVDGIIIEANQAFLDICKLERKRIIDKSVENIYHEKTASMLQKFEAVLRGEVVSFDINHNDEKYYLVNSFVIGNNKVGGLYTDISYQKKAELEILKEKLEAEESNMLKSQFLSNMSHEIRTPMNGVIGIIQLLEKTGLSKDQMELVTILRKSSKSLLSIINDILDYSKIESGIFELEMVKFNIEDIIDDVISLFKTSFIEKNLQITVKKDPKALKTYLGDPFRVRQVLTNLIGNAIKYTPQGGIVLSLRFVDSLNDGTSTLEFCVEDTGIGIDSKHQKMIFNSFSQADVSDTRLFGGTGLGLAISDKLVHLMGGDIWVESEIGLGSKFYFTFMVKNSHMDFLSTEDDKFIVAEPSHDNTSKCVLLVEDDRVSQIVAEKFLLTASYNVIIANNGEQALSILDKEQIDLILMDIQMPVLGGYETTKLIRAKEDSRVNSLPIIAMTAMAYEQDKDKCLLVGMDDYIRKPIQFEEMIQKSIIGVVKTANT